MNPVNWWHRQEGGAIAKERPEPPGADQPYPNIASVPAKPSPPDAKAMKELTDSLVADRTNAQHEAEAAPLADPSSPTASPNLFGIGTAPPPPPPGAAPPAKSGTSGSQGTPIASASMPAVNAPVTPPSAAPRKSVQSTPLAPPPTSAPTAAGQSASSSAAPPAKTASAATPKAATPVADASPAGPPPVLPAAPPPRPAVAGPPPAPVVTPKPMPTPAGGTSATIVFLNEASNLTPPAADEVKAFATKRGKGTISVIGYGDSTSNDPDAQSAAVNLGLSRAQSIVSVLRAAGVPDNAIRVSAEASGRGASLQVLQ
jgi:outer membrane protein OmpA-like peptidoglycan-associated protein